MDVHTAGATRRGRHRAPSQPSRPAPSRLRGTILTLLAMLFVTSFVASTPAYSAPLPAGAVNVSDSFSRTIAAGSLGSAPIGGAWAVRPTELAAVRDGGRLGPVASGQVSAALSGIRTLDQSAELSFTLSTLPTSGQIQVYVLARHQSGGDAVGARLVVRPGGAMSLQTVAIVSGTVRVVGRTATPPGVIKAGQLYTIGVQVAGTSTTRLDARAWPSAATVPGWQVSTASTARLVSTAGGLQLIALNTGTTRITVIADALVGRTTDSPTTSTASTQDGIAQPVPTISAQSTVPAPTTSAPATTPPPPATPSVTASPSAAPTTASTPPAAPTTTSAAPPAAPTAPSTSYVSPGATGVPKGTQLTPVYGNIVVRTDGTVIDGQDIHGKVTVLAKNVVIRNSIIRGENYTVPSQCLIIAIDRAVSNLQVSNSELVPEFPSVNGEVGICGHDFSITGSNIHGTVDGVGAYGSNVTISGNYIHGLAWYAYDPNQTDGSHSDGIQITGGSNITITGNYISPDNPRAGSSLQVASGNSVVGTLRVTGNYMDYGVATVHLNSRGKGQLGPVTMANNTIGGHVTNGDYFGTADAGVLLSLSGNVWAATGKSAPVWIG